MIVILYFPVNLAPFLPTMAAAPPPDDAPITVAIWSDTHTKHGDCVVPDADIFIHCGARTRLQGVFFFHYFGLFLSYPILQAISRHFADQGTLVRWSWDEISSF